MTTSPLKSPEAMSKLKTPEELANGRYKEQTDRHADKRTGFKAGISYTREHEVKPLVEKLDSALAYWKMYAKGIKPILAQADVEFYVISEIESLLSLYTNEVK